MTAAHVPNAVRLYAADGIRIFRFGGMVEHVTLDKRWVSKNKRS